MGQAFGAAGKLPAVNTVLPTSNVGRRICRPCGEDQQDWLIHAVKMIQGATELVDWLDAVLPEDISHRDLVVQPFHSLMSGGDQCTILEDLALRYVVATLGRESIARRGRADMFIVYSGASRMLHQNHRIRELLGNAMLIQFPTIIRPFKAVPALCSKGWSSCLPTPQVFC